MDSNMMIGPGQSCVHCGEVYGMHLRTCTLMKYGGNLPMIISGKLHCGMDCVFGKNVVIEVAEEVVLGDRCTIPDNAYLGGRRIEVGDDWYGYSWEWKRFDIGRGRRDEEHAIFRMGSRCTTHDNKIDLAREVIIGDDVGLSPEVTIYTHGYWLSPLEGFPCKHGPVEIGSGTIVGYRSVILAGAAIPERCVIGAQSVVTGELPYPHWIYAGNPLKFLRQVTPMPGWGTAEWVVRLLNEYMQTCKYRRMTIEVALDYPNVRCNGLTVNVEQQTATGEEDECSDDFRWFLFSHGIRIYTHRRFRKLPMGGK